MSNKVEYVNYDEDEDYEDSMQPLKKWEALAMILIYLVSACISVGTVFYLIILIRRAFS